MSEPVPTPAELFANQAQRWQAGERVLVEAYLERWPGLHAQPDLVVRLVCREALLRREAGETPTLDEYLHRFPDRAAELRRRLALFEALHLASDPNAPTLHFPGEAPPPRSRIGKLRSQWPSITGYEILDYLDGGGQGDVYRARHIRLDRIVALKVLRVHVELEPEDVARFHREGQVSALLDHPNIVRIYDYSEHDGRRFLSMELAEGGSLKQLLQKTRWLPGDTAAELLATLAHAIQHTHDRGILHRDLKPGNVLFTREGTPKLADFGLAKRLRGEATELTQTRAIMGTAGYMAPEQASGKTRHATFATDVYGLGAVLYSVLTGLPPFPGDDLVDVLIAIRTEPPRPPRELNPEVPHALERICLRCLEKDPARRYPSATAFAEELGEFLAGLLTLAEPAPLTHAPPETAAPPAAMPSDPHDSVEPVPPSGEPDLSDSTREAVSSRRPGDAQWGPIIPGYEILECIGRGGMGVVYKARQLSLNRIVALKTIHGEVRERAWQRLRQEAEVIASLQHPHIVQVYDLGESQDLVYVAMEYIDGGDLHRMIRGQRQPPRASAELLEQVAQAAGFAHRERLIHRDLKPSNILLALGARQRRDPADPDPPARAVFGFPKVTDFGLVRIGREEDEEEGQIFGTPSYMAPEQATGRDSAIGPATDVWSLGIMLYQMLTGAIPFRGSNIMETLRQVIEDEVVPPSKLVKVPSGLEAICLRCLQREPHQRYGDGEILAEDLRRYLNGQTPHAAQKGKGLWERLKFWKG